MKKVSINITKTEFFAIFIYLEKSNLDAKALSAYHVQTRLLSEVFEQMLLVSNKWQYVYGNYDVKKYHLRESEAFSLAVALMDDCPNSILQDVLSRLDKALNDNGITVKKMLTHGT